MQDYLIIKTYNYIGSVAVDWINDKVYWTDEGTSRIEVAELSGAHRSVLIAAVIKRPRRLVVDPMNG